MKVIPTRDISGNLGFKLIAENNIEKNLLTEFEIVTVTAVQEVNDGLVTTLDLTGSL